MSKMSISMKDCEQIVNDNGPAGHDNVTALISISISHVASKISDLSISGLKSFID